MRWQVSGTEMSATVSRRVMKTVLMPGRRLIWASWPSTQTPPSWSIHWLTALATARTGAGASWVASRRVGTAVTLGEPTDSTAYVAVSRARLEFASPPRPPRLGGMTTDLGLPPVLDPDSAREVLLAAPRGYCAGVDRAVITVEKALDLYGAPVYVRKQIVHNKHVVANLESRGAIFVEELDEVPEGQTVVFSAHGVSPAVHAEAAERA